VNSFGSPINFRQIGHALIVVALLLLFTALVPAQVPVEPTKSPAESAKTGTDTAKRSPEPNKTAVDPVVSGGDLAKSPITSPAEPSAQPADLTKSADALLIRIERARALIAAHRLDTAASELESVRATAQDNALKNITSIMLMNVYLEEGNYGRAEALLEESFKNRSTQKDELLGTYFALAGQAVNGARTHLQRYRTFGISTTDASLPAEAASDLNRLRSLLERMIVQAKEISSGRRAYDSLSLLEDVLGLRLSLARDNEDQVKWESEYAIARESLASSQTQIASLGGIPPLRPGKVNNPSSASPYSTKQRVTDAKPPDKDHTSTDSSRGASAVTGTNQPSAAKPGESDANEAGSLNAFAIRKVVPRYPPVAKQSGAAGLVRVYVIVEGGKVIAISRSEGPILLRQAAEDAARQWSFQSVSIEGRPTRLTGYIDFNFTL
jgi:outer membrane biosynthesis protein TonB/cell division protein ZapA (FtsZ GTPase activity inhibitor)